jgi:hypothetical protein
MPNPYNYHEPTADEMARHEAAKAEIRAEHFAAMRVGTAGRRCRHSAPTPVAMAGPRVCPGCGRAYGLKRRCYDSACPHGPREPKKVDLKGTISTPESRELIRIQREKLDREDRKQRLKRLALVKDKPTS